MSTLLLTSKQFRDTKFNVTPTGVMFNRFTGKIVKAFKNKQGYVQVFITINRKRLGLYLHRIVGELFLTKPDGKNTINHLDNNRSNNSAKNLEWTTHKENIAYKVAQGRQCKGSKRPLAKLSEQKVELMRILYAQKVSVTKIAKAFGVCFTTAFKAVTKQSWYHVA